MRGEYLLFNLIVVTGPLLLSFDRKVRYVRRWPQALLASALVLIPYLLWDTAVQGRHWWFNPRFTLGIRVLGLPVGEWLFFITVPFSCLFIWEIIDRSHPARLAPGLRSAPFFALVAAAPGLYFYLSGRQYTGLALMVLAAVAGLDRLSGIRLLEQRRTWAYLSLLTAAMLLFNGYLTARPVVLYDPAFQLNLRLYTIPVEDFVYGYGHLLLCTLLYERIKRMRKK